MLFFPSLVLSALVSALPLLDSYVTNCTSGFCNTEQFQLTIDVDTVVDNTVLLQNRKVSIAGTSSIFNSLPFLIPFDRQGAIFALSNSSVSLSNLELFRTNRLISTLDSLSSVCLSDVSFYMYQTLGHLFSADGGLIQLTNLRFNENVKFSSFLTKTAAKTKVSLSSTEINNALLAGSDPLVNGFETAVSCCSFTNLTQPARSRLIARFRHNEQQCPDQSDESSRTQLSNSAFTDTSASFYNFIVPGLASHTFISSNNSFTNSEEEITEPKICSTNASFVNCAFKGHAGIYFEQGDLTVSSCSFVGCTLLVDGDQYSPIFSIHIDDSYNETGSLSVDHTTFTDCAAEIGGAISAVGKFNITECNITSCKTTGSGYTPSPLPSYESPADSVMGETESWMNIPDDDEEDLIVGGGFALAGFKSKCVVSNCRFTDCVADYAGGGMAVYSDGNLVLTGLVFNACKAGTFAAAIFVYPDVFDYPDTTSEVDLAKCITDYADCARKAGCFSTEDVTPQCESRLKQCFSDLPAACQEALYDSEEETHSMEGSCQTYLSDCVRDHGRCSLDDPNPSESCRSIRRQCETLLAQEGLCPEFATSSEEDEPAVDCDALLEDCYTKEGCTLQDIKDNNKNCAAVSATCADNQPAVCKIHYVDSSDEFGSDELPSYESEKANAVIAFMSCLSEGIEDSSSTEAESAAQNCISHLDADYKDYVQKCFDAHSSSYSAAEEQCSDDESCLFRLLSLAILKSHSDCVDYVAVINMITVEEASCLLEEQPSDDCLALFEAAATRANNVTHAVQRPAHRPIRSLLNTTVATPAFPPKPKRNLSASKVSSRLPRLRYPHRPAAPASRSPAPSSSLLSTFLPRFVHASRNDDSYLVIRNCAFQDCEVTNNTDLSAGIDVVIPNANANDNTKQVTVENCYTNNDAAKSFALVDPTAPPSSDTSSQTPTLTIGITQTDNALEEAEHFPTEPDESVPSESPNDDDNNTVIIVVVVVVVVVVILIVVILICCCCCRGKKETKYETKDPKEMEMMEEDEQTDPEPYTEVQDTDQD